MSATSRAGRRHGAHASRHPPIYIASKTLASHTVSDGRLRFVQTAYGQVTPTSVHAVERLTSSISRLEAESVPDFRDGCKLISPIAPERASLIEIERPLEFHSRLFDVHAYYGYHSVSLSRQA